MRSTRNHSHLIHKFFIITFYKKYKFYAMLCTYCINTVYIYCIYSKQYIYYTLYV